MSMLAENIFSKKAPLQLADAMQENANPSSSFETTAETTHSDATTSRVCRFRQIVLISMLFSH
jgi:hypothetical protein